MTGWHVVYSLKVKNVPKESDQENKTGTDYKIKHISMCLETEGTKQKGKVKIKNVFQRGHNLFMRAVTSSLTFSIDLVDLEWSSMLIRFSSIKTCKKANVNLTKL